jgi:hypothetical protein
MGMEHVRQTLGLNESVEYDKMAVCLNGDIVNDSVLQRPADNATHCPDCGAKVIDACPSCSEPIRGARIDRRPHGTRTEPLAPDPERPANCRGCGEPLPWTKPKVERVKAEDDDVDAMVLYAVHRLPHGATVFGSGHLLEAVPHLANDALAATAKAAARRGYFSEKDGRFSLTIDGRRRANHVLDRVGLRPKLYSLDFASRRPTLADAILLYGMSGGRYGGAIWYEELYIQFPSVSSAAIKESILKLRDDGLMVMAEQTLLRRITRGDRATWDFSLASQVTRDGIRRRGALLNDRKNIGLMAQPANTLTAPGTLDDVADFLRAVPRGLRELSSEHRYDGRPTLPMNDEYDLQDFVRAFLKMRYAKATFEDAVGKVAGQGGRVDFALGDEKIFVELKVFKSEADWKKSMLPDISSKIERYSRDPKCEVIFFLVYDPGQKFRDARSAEADLSGLRTISGKDIEVRLIVTPQP